MFGNRNTPAGRRLLMYSVNHSASPTHFTKRALSLMFLKGHSEDHINKLAYYSSSRPPLQTSPSPSGKICSMNFLQLLLSYIFAAGTSALAERDTVSRLPGQANDMKFICLSHFPEFMRHKFSYSSTENAVQEWLAYAAVLCDTSGGTRE